MLHHAAEDGALGDRTIVRIDRRRDALKRRAVLLRLRCHGVEQKAQRRLDVLAVDPVVFLIGDTAAVVDGAVDHQDGGAAARFDPGRAVHLLQVGRAQIEMPQGVAVLGLKAHRRRRARHPLVVVPPLLEVAVGGCLAQPARPQADRAVGRLDPVFLQDPDRLRRREMPALLVEGPKLHRRDRLAVAFELRRRDDLRLAAIRAMQRSGVKLPAQPAVEGRPRHAVERGRVGDHALAIGMPRRQGFQAMAQADQRLVRDARPSLRHWPRPDSYRASASRSP
jgi:hypothetical protein